MTIKSVFASPRDFSWGLSLFHFQARRGWLAIALAVTVVPGFALAQITPDSAASQPSATSSKPQQQSATAPLSGVSAPAGYILSPNDQVGVEVFGEEAVLAGSIFWKQSRWQVDIRASLRLKG
jgi:hypothetical protein